jgi:phosphatidylserine/phosphatidylglycerophosphate/cardiolipin synthase-like enzyme
VAAAAAHRPKAEPPASSQHPALKAVAPALPLAAPKVGGWLARIMGRKDVIPSISTPAVPNDQAAGTTPPAVKYNMDEYNWSGFICPYCNASNFVSCARCPPAAFPLALVRASEIYYWPIERRERNQAGRPGKLHAKVAIIDDMALVSSANLTDDAFNRNLEVGLLVKNPEFLVTAKSYFESLIAAGTLSRLAG